MQVLVHHGLFPTAPSQPWMAVSVNLLAFYCALFERSCNAINALASALKSHYSWQGFHMTDTEVRFNLMLELLLTSFRRVNLSKIHFVGALAMLSSGLTFCKFKLNDNWKQLFNKVAIVWPIFKPPCTTTISLHPPCIQVDAHNFWSSNVLPALVAYYMVGPPMKGVIYILRWMGISITVTAMLWVIVHHFTILCTLFPKTLLTTLATG